MRRKTILIMFLIFVFAFGNINVSAAVKAKSIKINGSKKSYVMNVNTTKTLTAKVNPKSLKNNIKWKTSNKRIVSVKNKKKGKVIIKALKPGTSYIQAYVGKKKSKKIKIIVKAPLKSITMTAPKTILSPGETVKASISFNPVNTTDKKTITWSSSNTNIATVSANGVITAVKVGEAVINGKAVNNKSASLKITVKKRTSLPMSGDVENYYNKVDLEFAEEIGRTLAYDSKFFDHKLGFRNAGSDAEHKMAAELEKIFENKVGLKPENVEQVEVNVDKWQFNSASLKVNYNTAAGAQKITNRDIISYASNGTDGDLTADIVDVGLGTKKQYDEIKATEGDADFFDGKIVLAEINQYNLWWITTHYMEAYEQGASAILFYEGEDSYGGYKDDAAVIQDICAPDYIPCASISKDAGLELKSAIENAIDTPRATLNIDNTVGHSQSDKAYNVVGKIPGTGNTGQQIIYAAHYDKYFSGWEDDSIAIGLVAAIAKAMVDSDYKPVNDIVFIAFSGEEWGQSASLADWGVGSWEQIQKVAPQWQGSTLAMINFELPGIDTGAKYGIMRSTKELGNVNQNFLDTGLLAKAPKFYSAKTGSEPVANKSYKITDGVQVLNDDTIFLTDAASFQMSGVPCIVPREETRAKWTTDFYHTMYDDIDSDGINAAKYSSDLVEFDIGLYGALGQYMDKTPAHALDLSSRISQLEAAITQETTDALESQVTKINDYESALDQLKLKNTKYLEEAKEINERYVDAYRSYESEAVLQGIIDEGKALNEKMLDAFVLLQDAIVGVNGDYDGTRIKHANVQSNVANLKTAINKLQNPTTKTDVNDAMVALRKLPSASYAYRFGKVAYTDMVNMTNGTGTDNEGRDIPTSNWGYNNLIPAPTTSSGPESFWDASQSIMEKADYDPATRTVGDDCSLLASDYADAVLVLQEALSDMEGKFSVYFDGELTALNEILEALE